MYDTGGFEQIPHVVISAYSFCTSMVFVVPIFQEFSEDTEGDYSEEG